MTNLPRVRLPSCATSFAGTLNGFPRRTRRRAIPRFLEGLGRAEAEQMLAHWPVHCRQAQRPPETFGDPNAWTAWLILGGRGAGKTRTGAEWVHGIAQGEPGFAEPRAGRIALVGETFAAVRDVMIEGPAGILSLYTDRHARRPTWLPALRRLQWDNGAVAHAFSSEDPDGLRGPQFEAAWCDELAKWRYPTETWDMLQFGLRLGPAPREIVTTTPRPIPLLKRRGFWPTRACGSAARAPWTMRPISRPPSWTRSSANMRARA